MAIPSSAGIKQRIVASLVTKGLTQKAHDPATGEVIDTGVITPAMNDIVDSIVDGVIAGFIDFQTNTKPVVAVTTAPGTATGVLV